MKQAVKIRHPLAEISIKPANKVNAMRLKRAVRSALDEYLDEDRVPASAVHEEAEQRYGKAYRTPGYYLRIYRLRAELTQAKLAERVGIKQHHLSEMEHNKRPIGKTSAKKLAKILNCSYQKLL
jgi:DNA-binding XRE family transcriptional regulator